MFSPTTPQNQHQNLKNEDSQLVLAQLLMSERLSSFILCQIQPLQGCKPKLRRFIMNKETVIHDL